MFGTETTGDTSGYGGLQVRRPPPLPAQRPYGSYFDELADALGGALEQSGSSFGDAVERVSTEFGELTFYVRREKLLDVAARLRDEPRWPSSCAWACPACTTPPTPGASCMRSTP
jgi:NADH-quinone oxidoreductase subunit C